MDIFQQGLDLMNAKLYQEALIKFDIAIDVQQVKEAYRERAYCLQILDFHLDAIEDFTSATKYFPTHANNFYGRALSNGSLGYYDQALVDINQAISLSKINSAENPTLDEIARKMGYDNTTRFYEIYLSELTNEMNESDETIRGLNIKKPIRRPR